MDENWAIVEKPTSKNGLPDHWDDINIDIDELSYRVMDTFTSREKAREYIKNNYGMYGSEAKVINLDEI